MKGEILKAPWTTKQIEQLEKRQERDDMHPYTCVCGHSLEPYPDGWHCEFGCGYHQDWCLRVDAEESEGSDGNNNSNT